jgi:hypothetical protein
MTKIRQGEHTTLTETASIVVKELKKYPGIKMIAPGVIDARRSGKRYITVVYTSGGFELIISGTGVQKIAVHLKNVSEAPNLIKQLKNRKI